MQVSRENGWAYRVLCDVGCDAQSQSADSVDAAVAKATSAGWHAERGDVHLCPNHNKERHKLRQRLARLEGRLACLEGGAV